MGVFSLLKVKTLRPIKEGEEIFTHYGYKAGKFPADFPWYQKAEAEYLAEVENGVHR